MKKYVAKFVSIMLVFCLIVSVPVIEVRAISQATVESRLTGYINQYVGKTANSNQWYMGIQCKGFANWIFKNIFGVYIGPYPESANYKITNPQAETIGIIEPGNLNESTAKALLQKGKPGDYIQVQRSIAKSGGKCGPHSMILVEVRSDGVVVFDCNSDGKNTIKKYLYTWSKFDYDNRAMSLYRAKSYEVDANSTSTSTSIALTKDNNYPTPITAYPAATAGKVTVYNSNFEAYSQSTRYIAYNDLCTINAVYTNGYCSVTYPTSGGTNTAYVKTSDFITNGVTPYSYTPTSNLTTYIRSNLSETFGSVFTTDKCTVVGKTGEKLQIIYPVSSGYKLSWISVPSVVASDFPTPLYGYNSSSIERTTVYESVSTMGTYYGQIFVDDKCTLNAVNVSEGWIQVTYPVGNSTKTGYVYLDQFIPTSSKLTTFYTTTVTKQTTSYRKSDMGTAYGYVSVGDKITVVGKSGNKLQVIYPVDSGGYKIAWIYNTDVQKNLTNILVTSNPSKISYIEGENLDTSGLIITARYDDGSTANVTNFCSLSGYSNNVGVKTVNVSYEGKQTAFTVTVKSKSPTGIKIITNPTKTSYYVGDNINLDGLSVQATYNNGITASVEDYDVESSGAMSTAGRKTISVSYLYNDIIKTTSFNITVEKPQIEMSKASFTMKKGDTSTVTATTIPTSQNVSWKSSDTSVATVSGGKITAVGSGATTISASFIYNGISYASETTVTVSEDPVTLESIAVNTSPKKTSYEIGEALDTTDLTLKLVYSNGTSTIISSGYTTSGFDSQSVGTKTITVLYEGKTATFNVTVNKAPDTNITLNAPQLVVDTKKAQIGEQVTIRIMLKNNPGIISYRLNVKYDSDALTLENASAADFTDTSFGPTSKNPFTVLWSDALHGDNTTNGTIAELTFHVNDDVAEGNYPITITYDAEDIFNDDWENVEFETVAGAVNVVSQVVTDEWLTDDKNHWKLNSTGDVIEKSQHSGGVANCHTKAVCEVCGEEYGEKDFQHHDGTTEMRGAKDANCKEEGYTGDIYCKACDKIMTSGSVIAKTNAHVWNVGEITKEPTMTEAGVKTYTCTICGEKKQEEIFKETEEKLVEKITLNESASFMKVGNTLVLSAIVTPVDASNTALVWSSSDETIATVDTAGRITALKSGQTTITARAKDGSGVTANCVIVVSKAQQKLEGMTSYEKTYGDASFNLDMELSEGDGDITYESSNKEVVTVNDSGKVTIKGAGIATITVTAEATTEYMEASVEITIVVAKAEQKLEGTTSYTKSVGDADFELEITQPFGEGMLVYTSSDTAVATVNSAGKVSVIGAGETTVTVIAEETNDYKKARLDIAIKVEETIQPPTETPGATNTPEPTKTPVPTSTPEPIKTPEPTETPVPTSTPGSTATLVPTETSGPANNTEPTQNAGTAQPSVNIDKTGMSEQPSTVTVSAKGKTLKDTTSNAVYKVTKSGTVANERVTGAEVEYTKPLSSSTSITIPNTVTINGVQYKVTSIANNAFKNDKALTKITIPSNVKQIGKQAFSGCKKLKSVVIGKNVTTIGDKAFYKCIAINKLIIPSNVKKLGTQVFYGCKKLKTITIKTSKLTYKNVGSNAFKGIYKKSIIKVPKKQLATYKKLLKAKGLPAKAVIKK